MQIERKSKCIWMINGKRFDVRSRVTYRPKFDGAREAIQQYLEGVHPGKKWFEISAIIDA